MLIRTSIFIPVSKARTSIIPSCSLISSSCRYFHSNNNNNRGDAGGYSSPSSNENFSNNQERRQNHHHQVSLFSNKRSTTPFIVKDREPFPGTELRDGKTKIAVLIDGEKVTPEDYQKNVEKELLVNNNDGNNNNNNNAICLRRYFRYEKSQDWITRFSSLIEEPQVDANAETEEKSQQQPQRNQTTAKDNNNENADESTRKIRKTPNTSSLNALLGPPQYFRVDSFIPINMQIAADASHLVEFRHENLISGIAFVVTEEEVEPYKTLVENKFKAIPGVKMFVVGCGKWKEKK